MNPHTPELLPVRMLNAFTFCPRLFYLEWVQHEWAENHFTVQGTHQHKRVDAPSGDLDDQASPAATSVEMSAPGEGLIARIDLVEHDPDAGTSATGQDEATQTPSTDALSPVDYKRGSKPDTPLGAWEPERVQLCAQGLILRENGRRCDRGVLYFAASRQRVTVEFDDALVARTRELIRQARQCADEGLIPPPLRDSPKCAGCSLAPICLPDETTLLSGPTPASPPTSPLRQLRPRNQDALPVYIRHFAARVSKRGDTLVINHEGVHLGDARLQQTSHVVAMGSVAFSPQAIKALCEANIPVAHLSFGGWFYGTTRGHDHRNVERRLRQFDAARDPRASLTLAARFVSAKIHNARVLLRRNHPDPPKDALRRLKRLSRDALLTDAIPSLLGVEGAAARLYFEHFGGMMKGPAAGHFDLNGRNRRPPRDPVNALLSLAYALLTKDMTLALSAVGFDPYLGFLHQPRYGRPALALDMMEELRPLIADSVVLTALNNGELHERDFIRRSGAVALGDEGRKRFIQAYERRMSATLTHPLFGYKITCRQLLEVQARLLDRHLMGEISPFPSFLSR